MGVGVCVFAGFRGNVLGTAWPVGVGVYVFAVFRGSGLGTAWPVGVGVYARRVSWERTRYGVDRGGIMLVHGNGKIGVNNFTLVE